MKEIIKKNLQMGISLLLGLTLVDVFYKKEFSIGNFIIRTVTIIILYTLFSWIEYKNKKKK